MPPRTFPAAWTHPAGSGMLPQMPSPRLAALLVLAGLGCQGGGAAPKASAGTPLAIDLATICHAIERSGAAALEPADQLYTMAQWLPANVSEDGRRWLVRFAKLGDDKAARRRMLETDARAAGVLDCPLLARWQ